MNTFDAGALSFPVDSGFHFLEQMAADFEMEQAAALSATGGEGYMPIPETTNENLSHCGLKLFDAGQKYHQTAVKRMADAGKIKKTAPKPKRAPSAESQLSNHTASSSITLVGNPQSNSLLTFLGLGGDINGYGNGWSLPPAQDQYSSFPNEFEPVDALNIGLTHNPLALAHAPAHATNAAASANSFTFTPTQQDATTFQSPSNESGSQPAALDFDMDFSWLENPVPMDDPFAQSASTSPGSQSSFQQQPNDNTNFSGGASSETPAPDNFITHSAFMGGSATTNAQTGSTQSLAQEAAIADIPPPVRDMTGIPPPTLDLTPTIRKNGTGCAFKNEEGRKKRVDELIEKGGLKPGQHDDWLGIVRTHKGEHKLHRHTAVEMEMPVDVQVDFERVRVAFYMHDHRISGQRDPLERYEAEGKPGYYKCPICGEHRKGVRPLMRHLEGQSHLNIIYLCDFEHGATTKESCRKMEWRAPSLNAHLKMDHGVSFGKRRTRKTKAEKRKELKTFKAKLAGISK
ncbi:hypothetical protein PENSPDRAFT_669022 [Peniophora sp. CONT]|nr:hypothetical protein PENSPDRAFT_669022 [Peniophora sp. CONT]